MYNIIPSKRYEHTLAFLQKVLPSPATILDLGVRNPFSEIMEQNGYTVKCLKGNHEEMMIQARDNVGTKNAWLKYGGFQTLLSFDTIDLINVPLDYFSWMVQLPFYFEVDNYILVHAGMLGM